MVEPCSRNNQYRRQWLDGVIQAGQRRKQVRRSRWFIPVAMGCAIGLVLPFAAKPLRGSLGSSEPIALTGGHVPVCSGGKVNRETCLVDGDTGWEKGVKWRLRDVDTPELSTPECNIEYQKALS